MDYDGGNQHQQNPTVLWTNAQLNTHDWKCRVEQDVFCCRERQQTGSWPRVLAHRPRCASIAALDTLALICPHLPLLPANGFPPRQLWKCHMRAGSGG